MVVKVALLSVLVVAVVAVAAPVTATPVPVVCSFVIPASNNIAELASAVNLSVPLVLITKVSLPAKPKRS